MKTARTVYEERTKSSATYKYGDAILFNHDYVLWLENNLQQEVDNECNCDCCSVSTFREDKP